MFDPECSRCGARGYGNCPVTPFCQSRVGGHGWRLVPYKVQDCIRQEE